jgi:hypothetical protein
MQSVKNIENRFIHAWFALTLLVFSVTALADDAATGWQVPEMPAPVAYAEVNLSPEQVTMLREQWGVEVLGIRLASGDYMMDFRYRVLDVDKALTLFDHQIKPYLIVDRTNIKLPVPMAAKVGALRPTNRGKNIKPNKNYFMIFGNPDRHVKAGETVTIVVGDFRIEHLLVN